MKTTTILLVILAVGLLVTGCSRTAPTKTVSTGANTVVDTSAGSVGADVAIVDDNTTNPDVGTLDNTTVSDELPQ